jgi:hypothetical protein
MSKCRKTLLPTVALFLFLGCETPNQGSVHMKQTKFQTVELTATLPGQASSNKAVLHVEVKNTGTNPVAVRVETPTYLTLLDAKGMAMAITNAGLKHLQPAAKPRLTTPEAVAISEFVRNKFRMLKPGGTLSEDVKLEEVFSLTPGKYSLQVEVPIYLDSPLGKGIRKVLELNEFQIRFVLGDPFIEGVNPLFFKFPSVLKRERVRSSGVHPNKVKASPASTPQKSFHHEGVQARHPTLARSMLLIPGSMSARRQLHRYSRGLVSIRGSNSVPFWLPKTFDVGRCPLLDVRSSSPPVRPGKSGLNTEHRKLNTGHPHPCNPRKSAVEFLRQLLLHATKLFFHLDRICPSELAILTRKQSKNRLIYER